MGIALDKITARLAAGDDVKPSEYAAAKLEDEFVEMQAAATAERDAKKAEVDRLAAIDATIVKLAADVDTASETLADSLVGALEARKAAQRARESLEQIVRAGCHTLAHEYGFFTTSDEVMARTGGRVVYMPVNSVTNLTHYEFPGSPEWITWRDARLAERDQADEG